MRPILYDPVVELEEAMGEERGSGMMLSPVDQMANFQTHTPSTGSQLVKEGNHQEDSMMMMMRCGGCVCV